MGTFSVIIPVYQAEKYVARCLESIRLQRYADFEVIIVDDGSTDTSLNICREYANTDSRFRVVHQENMGVSSARNRGLALAKNRFVVFVDADDYVSNDYLEKLYDCMEDSADLCISMGLYIDKDGQKTVNKHLCYHEVNSLRNKREVMTYLGNKTSVSLGIWSVCFRRELLDQNHIRFCTNYSNGEDIDFALSALFACNRVTWLEDICYYYNKDNIVSATTNVSVMSIKSILAMWHKWYCLLDDEKYPDIDVAQWKRLFSEQGNACLLSGHVLSYKDRKKVLAKTVEEKTFFRGNTDKLKRVTFELYLLLGYENIVGLVYVLMGGGRTCAKSCFINVVQNLSYLRFENYFDNLKHTKIGMIYEKKIINYYKYIGNWWSRKYGFKFSCQH